MENPTSILQLTDLAEATCGGTCNQGGKIALCSLEGEAATVPSGRGSSYLSPGRFLAVGVWREDIQGNFSRVR